MLARPRACMPAVPCCCDGSRARWRRPRGQHHQPQQEGCVVHGPTPACTHACAVCVPGPPALVPAAVTVLRPLRRPLGQHRQLQQHRAHPGRPHQARHHRPRHHHVCQDRRVRTCCHLPCHMLSSLCLESAALRLASGPLVTCGQLRACSCRFEEHGWQRVPGELLAGSLDRCLHKILCCRATAARNTSGRVQQRSVGPAAEAHSQGKRESSSCTQCTARSWRAGCQGRPPACWASSGARPQRIVA